ncbi:HEAT repeat domain-containing protein [Chloroflexi bacterium TSY]|nr:HEAT repeat domain-containing protein [Chloroflexi bacterium TSY]
MQDQPRLGNRNTRIRAVNLIHNIAMVEPTISESAVRALHGLLLSEDPVIRASASSALAFVYAEDARVSRSPDRLLEMLTDPLAVPERHVAARAIFLCALQNPMRVESFRTHLSELAQGDDPVARVGAHRTLEMLDMIPYAQPMIGGDSQHRTTSSILHRFRSSKFFGADFVWAAEYAVRRQSRLFPNDPSKIH